MSRNYREGQKNAIIAAALRNPHIRVEGFERMIPKVEKQPSSGPAINKPLKRRKQMNKTEAEFDRMLSARMRRDEIVSYEFEGITLRWGGTESCTPMSYTPDFTVFESLEASSTDTQGAAVRIKFIEIKGTHIFDRDTVRFKGARAAWPLFAFEMWQKKGGEWRQIL